MPNNREIDDILLSLKDDKERLDNLANPPKRRSMPKPKPASPPEEEPLRETVAPPDEIEPPKPKLNLVVTDISEIQSNYASHRPDPPAPPIREQNKKADKKAKKEKTPKPKKAKPEKKRAEKSEKPKREKAPKPKKERKQRTKAPKKSSDKKKIRIDFSKIRSAFAGAYRCIFKKDLTKKAKIRIITAVLCVVAIVSTGTAVYQVNYGYLHRYEKEYGITFPKGIRKDFCKNYGENQAVRGKITIGDSKKNILFLASINTVYPYLEHGSTIDKEQQFRSIRISADDFDTESLYATADGFLNASQSVTLSTLYDNHDYRVIACYYTNILSDDDDGYCFPYNIYGDLSQRGFAEFQDKIESRRLYDTGYKFNYYDKFLTVSVESDFMPNYLFVMLCVETDGKITKSDTAIPNEMVHYPSSYYQANGSHNPYQFAGKWYPEVLLDGKEYRLTSSDF